MKSKFDSLILIGNISGTNAIEQQGYLPRYKDCAHFNDIYQAMVWLLDKNIHTNACILINIDKFNDIETTSFVKLSIEKNCGVALIGKSDFKVSGAENFENFSLFEDKFLSNDPPTLDSNILSPEELDALLQD